MPTSIPSLLIPTTPVFVALLACGLFACGDGSAGLPDAGMDGQAGTGGVGAVDGGSGGVGGDGGTGGVGDDGGIGGTGGVGGDGGTGGTPSGDSPWTLPPGANVQVELPRGTLGPRTSNAVNPAGVDGITKEGGEWVMRRDWDENTDGGYLDFGAATLDPNGHTVLGFRLQVPAGQSAGHIIDGGGEVGYFEITNPNQHSHNAFIRHSMHAHHYISRGVVGDAIKVGQGTAHHHDAYVEMDVRPGGPNDKHYDGAQIFNQGKARLERIVFEWNNAGSIAATAGAVFSQQDGSMTVRDILILNPGGTWYPVRVGGTGAHDVDKIQVIGERQPNRGNGNLAPSHIVRITNGHPKFTLFNDVPGANSWIIE